MIILNFLKKNFGLFTVLILSFWAIKPLFVSGFFPMHDDTQVARVFEMGKMLGSGVFPVRWVPDLGYGYGYPIFNFYAPLAYYIGGIFTILGFNALLATKIMMVLGIVIAGVFMYLLAREFFGKLGGIISGLFYVYAPYHAVDIYVRGDVAEFWAYAFIPLAFLGFYKNNILIGSIGFSAIILSHNLTALMVTPFLLAFILILSISSYKAKKIFTIYNLLFTILMGLVLSAFYWIPAFLEMESTNVLSQIGGGADFRDHFVCAYQLWDSLWGFGGSVQGCVDGLSFKIGKLHILVSLIAIILTIFVSKIRRTKQGFIIFLFFLGFIISTFFTLEISKSIWQTFSIMEFFQYPWRFLLLASFFSSLLSGSFVFLSGKFKIKPYLAVLPLVFLLLLFNIKLFSPQTILSRTSEDYTNERAIKWVASKTSDEFLPPNFEKPKSEYEVRDKPIEFKETALEKSANTVSFIGALALIIGIILKYGKNKR